MFRNKGFIKSHLSELAKDARDRVRSLSIGTIIMVVVLIVGAVGIAIQDRIQDLSFQHEELIKSREHEFELEQERYLDRKYEIVETAIKIGYDAAEEQGGVIASEIIAGVEDEYGNNEMRLKRDLDNIASAENTPLISIISNAIQGKFILDIVNDNNDPWAGIRYKLISDFSLNCSAFGRTRTFAEEVAMHNNTGAAEYALYNIGNQINDKNIWNFLPIPEEELFAEEITNKVPLDEKFLEELFYKYNGDLAIYKYPEFIYTNYVYRRKDLADRPLVDPNGMRKEDSQIIIISNGFVIHDIISNTYLKDSIRRLDNELRLEKKELEQFIEKQELVLAGNIKSLENNFFLLVTIILIVVVIMAEYNNRKLKATIT